MRQSSFSRAGCALLLFVVAACGAESNGGAGGGGASAAGVGGDSDVGDSDVGGSDVGGSDSGGSDSGGSDSGGSDVGASDAGGSDVGGSDVGSGGGSDVGGAGGGDPVVPPDLCAGYADVVTFAELPYNDYTRRTTASQGGFPPDRIFVLPMTLATTPESYPTQGNTSMAEYQGPPTMRHMTISRSPCDFRTVDPTGANGPIAESAGTATIIGWNVGVEPLALVAGETYYFNYRNLNCAQSSCDASTSTNWPH